MFTRFANPNYFQKLSDKIYFPSLLASIVFSFNLSLFFFLCESAWLSPRRNGKNNVCACTVCLVVTFYIYLNGSLQFHFNCFPTHTSWYNCKSVCSNRCLFYISNANHRFNMGKTDLGNMVGLGCKTYIWASFIFHLCRTYFYFQCIRW